MGWADDNGASTPAGPDDKVADEPIVKFATDIPVRVRRSDEGVWVATSPMIPGLLVVCKDQKKLISRYIPEALRDLADAAELLLEGGGERDPTPEEIREMVEETTGINGTLRGRRGRK